MLTFTHANSKTLMCILFCKVVQIVAYFAPYSFRNQAKQFRLNCVPSVGLPFIRYDFCKDMTYFWISTFSM